MAGQLGAPSEMSSVLEPLVHLPIALVVVVGAMAVTVAVVVAWTCLRRTQARQE